MFLYAAECVCSCSVSWTSGVFCVQLSLFQYHTFVTDDGGTLVHLFVVWLKARAVLQCRIQMLENYCVVNGKVQTCRLYSVS